jgi:hypothetical protein
LDFSVVDAHDRLPELDRAALRPLKAIAADDAADPSPLRMARASSETFLSSLVAPPEKMTIRRPSNALCTTCFTARSAGLSMRSGHARPAGLWMYVSASRTSSALPMISGTR